MEVIGSFALRPRYLELSFGYRLNARLGGPESQSGCSGGEKKLYLSGTNHDSSVVQSVVTPPTAASRHNRCSVSVVERTSWFQRRIIYKSRKLRGETVLQNYSMHL